MALAIVLRTVLGSGVPLWLCRQLAVPNAIAESLGLAGPPDVGDVPVEAPGPGCFQHRPRALAGAQATSQLQLVLHITNTTSSQWRIMLNLCVSTTTSRYRSI